MRRSPIRGAGTLVAITALAMIPSTAPADMGTPDPLPGYPSCDYGRWNVELTIQPAPVSLADWSPDGTKLVSVDQIIDASTGQVIGKIPFEGPVSRPTWSADGKTIVFDSSKGNPAPLLPSEGEGEDLWAYDVPTGTFTRLTEDVNGSNSYARFSKHGRMLTWVRHGLHGHFRFIPMAAEVKRDENGTSYLIDEHALVPDDPTAVGYGAFTRPGDFTADGTGVILNSTAGNSGNGDVWQVDLGTLEWTNLTGSSPYWEEHPRVSPNGQKISFTSTRDHLWLGNTSGEISQMAGVPSLLDSLLIIPDAALFAQQPLFGMSAESYLANPDGSGQQCLSCGTSFAIEAGWYSRNGTFSPNGTKLALSQRAVSQVLVPGHPANTIQTTHAIGTAAGFETRPYPGQILIIAFDCN